MNPRAPLRAFVPLIAIASAIAARLIAHFSLGDAPHVMDEVAYVFQAKTYLTGHLTAPVTLPRGAFALWFVDDRTTKYGIFPPGWPAVMALGVLVHLRAWVNPVLHGMTTFMVARAARRVGASRAAVVASILYGFSPQALLLAASLMSHTVVAFGASLALWAGISANTAKPRRFAIAFGGIGVAITLLARPLCGVVVAIGLASLLGLALTRKKIDLSRTAPAALAIGIGVAALLLYNHAVTGGGLRFPQTVWFDEHAPPTGDPFFRYRPGCNALGFGAGHGCDEGIRNATHDLPNALSNTGDNLISWLFLAGGGPLAFLVPLALLYASRKNRDPLRMLAAIGATVPAAIFLYALYWYAGTCFGARFYHAALPALLLLGALGVTAADRWKKKMTMLVTLAWLALSGPGMYMGLVEIGDHYWGLDGRFERVLATWNHGPAVVMVAFKTDGLPMHYLRVTGFTSHSPHSVWHNSVRVLGALVMNSPDPKNDRVVFAKYHPAFVSQLRDEFPNHALYMYIAADEPEDDRIEAYRGEKWADPNAPAPKENFDGYVVPRGP